MLLRFWTVILCFSFVVTKNALAWEQIDSDLWRLESKELIFYKTSLNKFDITINVLDEHSTMPPEDRTNLLINASFFDVNFKPLGLIIKDGQIINKQHFGGSVLTGVLIKKNQKLTILHRDQVKQTDYPMLDFALQVGPRIIADGKTLKLKNSNVAERRSGLCLNPNGNLIIYITKKDSVIDFSGLQALLISPEVNCYNALNLDGGSSTQYQFYQNGKLQDSIVGFSSAPVYLKLFKKFD